MILKQSFDSIHCLVKFLLVRMFFGLQFFYSFFFSNILTFFFLCFLCFYYILFLLCYFFIFLFLTGDISEMAKTQLFAWEAYNKGEDAAHLQANPTQVELARKQFHSTKEKMLAAKKKKKIRKIWWTRTFDATITSRKIWRRIEICRIRPTWQRSERVRKSSTEIEICRRSTSTWTYICLGK